MNYQELLDKAELNGFVKIPTPPKFEKVALYSMATYRAARPNDSFDDEYKFVLVGEESYSGINTADELEAELPPMGV